MTSYYSRKMMEVAKQVIKFTPQLPVPSFSVYAKKKKKKKKKNTE